MGSWRQQASRIDDVVDAQWAEAVIFRPVAEADEYSVQGDDPTRPPFKSRGVFMRPDASTMNTQAGTRAESDFVLDIQDRLLPPYELRSEDRVEFPEQDGTVLQISYLDPDATGRTKVHLLRK